ncbi:MAG: xanthine dehydrogenase family protein molybdopterin-binding subunit [Alphaproteobacteria bacterium]
MNQPKSFQLDQVPTKFGIGQPVRRSEDTRFVQGRGQYCDDITLEGQTHGFVVRSTVAAGRINALEVEAARKMPGVLLVLTGADLDQAQANHVPCLVQLQNRDGSDAVMPKRPVLASDAVRYVGEAVAFVVAETFAQARAAGEAVELDCDFDPAVVATATAGDAGQPQVHEQAPGNIAFDWQYGDADATDAAFADAAQVVTLDLVNNRVVANPMETRGANAVWDADAGKLTMYTGTQGGWIIRDTLAKKTLKIDPENVRIITPDVGGGFGMKTFVYPEHLMVGFAARACGRPVKWTGERAESFLSDAMGRDHVTHAELALDSGHRIQGLRVLTRANMGAQLSQFAPFIPTGAALKVVSGIYDVKNLTYRVLGLFTNTTPVDAYRGAGRPESIYMIERLVDKAARQCGLGPVEFRKLNLIPSEAMPFKTVAGNTYDTGEFAAILDASIERADLGGLDQRRAEAKKNGRRLGLGFGCYIESTMGDPDEYADIRFDGDQVKVMVGTQSNGQGHETAYAQVLAEKLGLDFDKIQVVMGDTDAIPVGGGTGGSRSLTVQAAAINVAGDGVIEKAKNLAADDMEVSAGDVVFEAGLLKVAGTDISTPLTKVASTHPGALDTRAKATMEDWSFPNGCHIAEVEIDEATGVARVARYTIMDDFGIVVNPMLVAGQVHGGVVQGIGQALYEGVVYDEDGQLLTGSFVDYGMPRADHFPAFEFNYLEVPCANNALGIKGCGEAGALAAPPAVMNAIVDALWDGDPNNVPAIDMPATPQKLWRAMQ